MIFGRLDWTLEVERLIIRFYLLLKETDPSHLVNGVSRIFQMLGFTKRESEVLFGLTEHQSLIEVAKLNSLYCLALLAAYLEPLV